MWKLTGPEIGFMISAGYVGQLIGALLFGWIGERYGRMPAMIGSIAIFSVMSLGLRLRLGLQLAGLVPHAARHRPRRRGAGRRHLHQRADAGARTAAASCCCTSWCFRSASWRRACSALGRADSRLAVDVLHRRAAGDPGAVPARVAAGIAALARGAWPQRRGRSRAVDDRKRDAEGHRAAAAAGAAGGRDASTSRRRCPTCSAPPICGARWWSG